MATRGPRCRIWRLPWCPMLLATSSLVVGWICQPFRWTDMWLMGQPPKIGCIGKDSGTIYTWPKFLRFFFWAFFTPDRQRTWQTRSVFGTGQVRSDTFPVQWNGSGQALDVAKAPGRIGWQLHMNSKASLLHFQERQTMAHGPANGQWPGGRPKFAGCNPRYPNQNPNTVCMCSQLGAFWRGAKELRKRHFLGTEHLH